jgi:thioredoxin 1
MTAAVTDTTFTDTVLNADLPVVVDFWASWCGPCKAISPSFDALAEQLAGRVTLVKANLDEVPNAAVTYNVMTLPTFAVFSGGQLVTTFSGATSRDKLAEQIAQATGVR